MAHVSLVALIVSSIILSFISLLSLTVIYQLYVNLCCNRSVNNTKLVYSSSKADASPTSPSPSTPISLNIKSNTSTTTATNNDTDINTNIDGNVQRNQKSEILPFFRNTTLTSSTLFFVVSIIINVDRILSTQSYWLIAYPATAIPIFYFIARMVLTLIFIARLYYTFHGSTFEYSKCTIISLKFAWFLMPFFCVLSVLIYTVSTILVVVFSVLFILIDIILSCVLLYLYLKKLSILVNKDQENSMLIALMIKYTLLYSICFISTFIMFVLIIIVYFVDDIMDSDEGFRPIWILISIDSLLNSLSLWLNLSFAKPWYFRLCGKCHNKYKKCYDSTQDEVMLTNVQQNTDNNKTDCDTVEDMPVLTVESDISGNKAVIL